ncbi:MAG: hypothetical protein JO096_01675 [Alphaproteobacteria bacterium]|nr:hypothetical protein [Alphaproteobacteria bacterium]
MARKRRGPLEAFGDYESFTYLLTELELLVQAGTVQWSKATANATKLRLEELAARLQQAITQLERE